MSPCRPEIAHQLECLITAAGDLGACLLQEPLVPQQPPSFFSGDRKYALYPLPMESQVFPGEEQG